MIAALLAIASAADPTGAGTAVRSHTAATLPAGDVALRWPAGRSGLGLTETTDLWVAPFDLGLGGPRVGVEHGARAGAWIGSISPSLGAKTSLKRASLRLEANGTWTRGDQAISAEVAVDGRLLRQLVIADDVSRELSFDRLQSHVLGVWDTPHSRLELRVPLADQGQGLQWATVAGSWTHTTRRVHVAAGLGLLVGRPFDRYTLGHFTWWFWLPYPELDLVIRL